MKATRAEKNFYQKHLAQVLMNYAYKQDFHGAKGWMSEVRSSRMEADSKTSSTSTRQAI